MRRKSNSSEPVAENSLSLLPAQSNAELFANHPWLDPETRKQPIKFRLRRKVASKPGRQPKAGDKNIELIVCGRVPMEGGKWHMDAEIKFETRITVELVAFEYLKIAYRDFRPESVMFDHSRGDLLQLEEIYGAFIRHE